MKIGFIADGHYWARGADDKFRNDAGVEYQEQAQVNTTQKAIVHSYEHVMLEFPDWKPSYPGEKAPYPHLVPSGRKGYYKGAMTSRREVEEFSARTGKRWGSP